MISRSATWESCAAVPPGTIRSSARSVRFAASARFRKISGRARALVARGARTGLLPAQRGRAALQELPQAHFDRFWDLNFLFAQTPDQRHRRGVAVQKLLALRAFGEMLCHRPLLRRR